MAKTKSNTPQPAKSVPAPEKKQEDAGAGETQGNGEPVIVALLVSAKTDGFRRCGRPWTKEQIRVELGDLEDGHAEALFAEPMLDVVSVAE